MSGRAAAAPGGVRTRPAVDPRFRERRVSVQREAGRRRLRRLLGVVALLATGGVAAAIVLSPLLALDEVAVTGAGERAAEVRAASGDALGSPLLLVDTGAVEAQVEQLSWVADAAVARELPNTLRITVTPRVAVAWARDAKGALALVDARGVVLGTAAVPPEGLVELLGVTGIPAPGQRLAPSAPARVAAALGPLAGRVATVVVARGQAVLQLAGGPEVRFGGLDRLAEKARASAAVLDAIAPGTVGYVDVRVPSAPVTG